MTTKIKSQNQDPEIEDLLQDNAWVELGFWLQLVL